MYKHASRSSALPKNVIDFDDYPAVRRRIFEAVRNSVAKSFPVKNNLYTVQLEDVNYADDEDISLEEQKQAILQGKSLAKKLVGNLAVYDNATDKLVSRTKSKTLMNVPYYTNRGTFIRNGVEYTMARQFRLLPNVYTRKTASGFIESQFNIKPRTGSQFRVEMDPATSVFSLKSSGRTIPLYPVLHAMGVQDDDLKNVWGEEIWKANYANKVSPHAINWMRTTAYKTTPEEESGNKIQKTAAISLQDIGEERLKTGLLNYFTKMELDPEGTTRTLGAAYPNVTPEAILASTHKIIRVNRGEDEVDDRDSLQYQTVHDVSDFLPEKIASDQNGIMRQYLWKLTGKKGDISSMPSGILDKHVSHLFNLSGIGQAVEEISPMDMYNQNQRVMRLGEGAMASVDVAPKESRNVQHSYIGFVDPIRSPECHSADTEVMTEIGWKSWPEVTMQDKLACRINDRLEFHTPIKLIESEYSGPMYGTTSATLNYLVTPNHRMWVKPIDSNVWRFELAGTICGKNRIVSASHFPKISNTPDISFVVPSIEVRNGGHPNIVQAIPMELWAPFMGYYLSEGSASKYSTQISQSKEKNPIIYNKIKNLLALLPFSFTELKAGTGFVHSGKQLSIYLSRFGKSDTKYIPTYIFNALPEHRQLFIDALLDGDGRKSKSGRVKTLCTISKQLAEDFSRLQFLQGNTSVVTFEPDTRDHNTSIGGTWCVYCHSRKTRTIYFKNNRHPEGQQAIVAYTGKVYCAEVPGGLLFTRRTNTPGFWSGNSLKVGLDLYFARGVAKGPNNLLYRQFINPRTGEQEWIDHKTASDAIITFPGIIQAAKQNKEAYAPAMVRSKGIFYVPLKEIEYELPSGDDMFSRGANTVPLKSGVKGMRLLMGSKYASQALPLTQREAPLVQTMHEDGTSESDYFGKFMGAIKAKGSGRVTRTAKNGLFVEYDNGEKDFIELYNNFPFSRKTFINNFPLVKTGDYFKPGQVLASSNFTDDAGKAASGINLRIGYMGYQGQNYEDAIVISEGASKKLTAEMMYNTGAEKHEGTHIDKRRFMTLFPGKFTKDQLNTVDDTGVVKSGTILKFGDPIVLSSQERIPSLSTMGRRTNVDQSQVWEHHFPGIVTDVSETKDGFKVFMRSNAPALDGDKLSLPFGSKGVIANVVPDDKMPKDSQGRPLEILISPLSIISRCYDKDTEFCTQAGWKFGKDITPDDKFISYNTGTGEYSIESQIAPFFKQQYTGKLCTFKNRLMDFAVTPDHKMWARCTAKYPFKQRLAKDLMHVQSEIPCVGSAIPGTDTDFILPEIEIKHKDIFTTNEEIKIPAEIWAEFLGWYIAEGNTTYDEKTGEYKIHIAQNKEVHPEYCLEIENLLKKLPFKFNFSEANMQFHIYSERLAAYTRTLGKCHDKFIPDWVFTQSLSTRQKFLDAFWKGDGRYLEHGTDKNPSRATGSRSLQLVSDLQRLLIYQGKSANVYPMSVKKSDKPIWRCGVHGKSFRLLESKNWSEVDYTGEIYCPSVATGYIVTRRHGKMLIAGNTNPAQLHSAALGKVAEVTGKPYILPGFTDMDLTAFAEDELAKNNLTDTEDVYDPVLNKTIPKVFVGKTYVYRLQQTAEAKGKSRATGGYSQDEDPGRGGPEGSKHVGDMEYGAFLAHGVPDVIKDMKLIKGQKNDTFWRQLKLGQTPAMPGTPFAYQKFKELIRAAGVNINEDRHQESIFAMTNEQARELTGNRKLNTGQTFSADKLLPIKGGLFSPEETGSLVGGDRFSYIELPEPMPNPIMEQSLKSILRLTQREFNNIIRGDVEVDGKTGGYALKSMLEKLDLKQAISTTKDQIINGSKSGRDSAIKRLGYLVAMERQKTKPSDFMMDRVPVLPPKYRPITRQGEMILSNEPNYMYKALFETIDDLEGSKALPKEYQTASREKVYDTYKALVGLVDPIQPELQQKRIGGIIQQMLGKGSPKHSWTQRKIIGSNMDVSGLAVVAPDPSLRLNQVGLPEEQAWTLYEPFVIRQLIKQGMPATAAVKEIEARGRLAYGALQQVVKERPVIVNRAPTLHKYSMMAYWPVLKKGHVLRIHPAVVGPYGMDFDGDYVNSVIAITCDPELGKKSEKILNPQTPIENPYINANVCIEGFNTTFDNLKGVYDMFVKLAVPAYENSLVAFINLKDFPHFTDGTPKDNKIFYTIPEGIYIWSYNEKTNRMEKARPVMFSVHQDRKVEIVNFKSGLQIYTDDDPRGIYGLKPGTFEFTRNTPSNATGMIVPRCIRMKDHVGDITTWTENEHTYSLTPELGYFIGTIIGDGWVGHSDNTPKNINLSGISEPVFDKYSKCLAVVAGEENPHIGKKTTEASEANGKYGACSTLTYYNIDLTRDILNWVGRGSDNKHLPVWAFTAPYSCRKAILEGLIDTDGSVAICHGKKKPQLNMSIQSNSFRLILELRFLCATLNVRSTIVTSKTPAGKPCWMLSLKTSDALKLKLSLTTKNKKDAYESGVVPTEASANESRTDYVPITTELALFARSVVPYKNGSGFSGLYDSVGRAIKRGYISRNMAKYLLDSFGDKLKTHKDYYLFSLYVENTDITWEIVESVDKTETVEEGYDLSVPGLETFMSLEGVILSNTASYSVPVSNAAVKQAIEKMMPEKNLLSAKNFKPHYIPSQEYIMGMHLATKEPSNKEPIRFANEAEAIKAYRQGKIKIDDPVIIVG